MHARYGLLALIPLLANALHAQAIEDPGPFTTYTTVTFETGRAGRTTLAVLDVLGRRVRILTEGSLGAGPHAFRWDGRDEVWRAVTAGRYLLRLQTEEGDSTRVIVKAE